MPKKEMKKSSTGLYIVIALVIGILIGFMVLPSITGSAIFTIFKAKGATTATEQNILLAKKLMATCTGNKYFCRDKVTRLTGVFMTFEGETTEGGPGGEIYVHTGTSGMSDILYLWCICNFKQTWYDYQCKDSLRGYSDDGGKTIYYWCDPGCKEGCLLGYSYLPEV